MSSRICHERKYLTNERWGIGYVANKDVLNLAGSGPENCYIKRAPGRDVTLRTVRTTLLASRTGGPLKFGSGCQVLDLR